MNHEQDVFLVQCPDTSHVLQQCEHVFSCGSSTMLQPANHDDARAARSRLPQVLEQKGLGGYKQGLQALLA